MLNRYAPEEYARRFSTAERRKLADKGHAMSDLSFPVETTDDLDNAIGLARTPAQRAHVKKQAKRLGASGKIPDTWAAAVPDHDRQVTDAILAAIALQEKAPDASDPNDRAVLAALHAAASAQDKDNRSHALGGLT